MLNWNYLEVFVTLSETLSFSETALQLNSSQPVVSRQIQALEEQVGKKLFFRTQRQVKLTPEGLELKRKLSPLVQEIHNAVEGMSSSAKNPIIHIRIASSFDAGERVLLPKILRIMKDSPQYQITLEYQSAEPIYENLLQGKLDFGFASKKSDHKSIVDHIIQDDEFVMIGPKNQSKNWEQLSQIPMIYYRLNDPFSEKFIRKNFSKAEQKKVFMRFCANSHRSMIQAATELQCYAVIPKSRWNQIESRHELEIVKRDAIKSPLYLICHDQIFHDPQKKIFRDLLLGSKDSFF